LSQSLVVKHRNHASLSALDYAAAVVLHLFVLAFIAGIGLWHHRLREFHPVSVEVRLISGQQLRQMQHHARPKKVVKLKLRSKPKPKPAPRLKIRPRAKSRPTSNFNPFKPLESATKYTPKAVTKVAPVNPEVAQLLQGQLSKREINRYVTMIQAAVQRHWKVPNIGRDVRDPLVEMILNPDGSVREVRILESSGNQALDASLVRAIEAAAPFQVPRRQFELFRDNRIRFHPLH